MVEEGVTMGDGEKALSTVLDESCWGDEVRVSDVEDGSNDAVKVLLDAADTVV